MARAETADRGGLTRFHYRIISVGGLGVLFDSMDVGIISFILAALIGAWHLDSVEIGVVASIGLVGMAVGAVLSGMWADRFGRRQIFMLTMLVYAVATGLSAAAITLWMLILLRFIVGLGLGGELPVTTTLVTEFLPRRHRGRGVIMLESFWAVGWLVAALVSYLLIPHFGWRAGFLVGLLPALYVWYLRRGIPESPRYLVRTGRADEAMAILHQSGADVSELGDLATASTSARRGGVSRLFSAKLRRRTVMLWILWAGMNFAYYGIFLWFPSVLVEHGYTLVESLKYTLIVTAVQVPGYLSAAWLIDRWGRKWVLGVYILMAALFAALFGNAHLTWQFLVFGSLLSFFNLGAWGATYTYTMEQYETLLRGTGSGWAMGVGRVGGIIGPTVVGWLFASHYGMTTVFYLFMAVLILTAVAVMLLGRETKGISLESLETTPESLGA